MDKSKKIRVLTNNFEIVQDLDKLVIKGNEKIKELNETIKDLKKQVDDFKKLTLEINEDFIDQIEKENKEHNKSLEDLKNQYKSELANLRNIQKLLVNKKGE